MVSWHAKNLQKSATTIKSLEKNTATTKPSILWLHQQVHLHRNVAIHLARWLVDACQETSYQLWIIQLMAEIQHLLIGSGSLLVQDFNSITTNTLCVFGIILGFACFDAVFLQQNPITCLKALRQVLVIHALHSTASNSSKRLSQERCTSLAKIPKYLWTNSNLTSCFWALAPNLGMWWAQRSARAWQIDSHIHQKKLENMYVPSK